MKIASLDFLGVNVTPKTNWSFLLVRTDDGRTGIGECTLSNQEPLLAAEAARLAVNVAGEDAGNRNRIARLIPHAPGGLVAHAVHSAFEQALWDLAGQAVGRPIHAMLGGALRASVPLYANINRGANPRTPEGFAAAATRAVAEGFRAVKLAPFEPLVWEDAADASQRAAYQQGLARIAAVRAAVGREIDIMVDAHWRFSPGGAARLVQDVAPFGLFWLECPVSEANHPEIRRIAALAQTAGVEIAPHNPTGPICHAHSVHLCATIPNLLPLEVQFGETDRFFTLVTGHDLRFARGAATLPDTPGLGSIIDEAGARLTPWQPMPKPWLDPRLG